MRLSIFLLSVLACFTAHAQTAREKAEMASLIKSANEPNEGGTAFQMQFYCGFSVPLMADYDFIRDRDWVSSNENAVGFCSHAQVAMYRMCSESPGHKESLRQLVKQIQCTNIPKDKDKPESPIVDLRDGTLRISFGRRSYTRVQGEVEKLLTNKR